MSISPKAAGVFLAALGVRAESGGVAWDMRPSRKSRKLHSFRGSDWAIDAASTKSLARLRGCVRRVRLSVFGTRLRQQPMWSTSGRRNRAGSLATVVRCQSSKNQEAHTLMNFGITECSHFMRGPTSAPSSRRRQARFAQDLWAVATTFVHGWSGMPHGPPWTYPRPRWSRGHRLSDPMQNRTNQTADPPFPHSPIERQDARVILRQPPQSVSGKWATRSPIRRK